MWEGERESRLTMRLGYSFMYWLFVSVVLYYMFTVIDSFGVHLLLGVQGPYVLIGKTLSDNRRQDPTSNEKQRAVCSYQRCCVNSSMIVMHST
jgi:hypothetical protein